MKLFGLMRIVAGIFVNLNGISADSTVIHRSIKRIRDKYPTYFGCCNFIDDISYEIDNCIYALINDGLITLSGSMLEKIVISDKLMLVEFEFDEHESLDIKNISDDIKSSMKRHSVRYKHLITAGAKNE